jgi:hypothetical protein
MNFTFENTLIKNYFEGSDEYIPVSELIYLHEHPLIKDSFLIEIERLINVTTELMIAKKMQGVIVQKFVDVTMKLGAELPSITQQNAPIILEHLRTIYKLCNSLLN